MANQAFIFDMDGVLINSEAAWVPYQKSFSTNLFSSAIYDKIGSTVGLSIDTIYENAYRHGFRMPRQEYYQAYDNQARLIYAAAEPTRYVNELLTYLQSRNFKVGLVSSSRMSWIKLALARLELVDAFDFILSLNDEPDIRPKPHPDGYLTAMKKLNATPNQTIILEDSNFGIRSASQSGAYTIGYTEHLLPDYHQDKTDIKAATMREVIEILDRRRN